MPATATSFPSLQDFVRDIMRRRGESYQREPTLIIQDYKLEQQVSADYDGRQLLELLQNADDAAGRDPRQQPGRVRIRLTGNTLDIANTGATFTEAGIESLLYSNLSPKSLEPDQIGAKGLGFRAVLNWVERLEIHSGSLHVAFSEAYAQQLLHDLQQGEAAEPVRRTLAQARQRTTRASHPIAVLRCAELLDDPDMEHEAAGYATLVRLQMQPIRLAALRRQLAEEFTPEVLVFLPNLTFVELDCEGSYRALTRTQQPGPADSQLVQVTQSTLGLATATHAWQVLTRAGVLPAECQPPTSDDDLVIGAQPYEVRLAWAADANRLEAGRLFAYFRTGVTFPLPVLLHATFNLTANRQSLLPTEANRFLLKLAAQLLVAAAQLVADQSLPAADPYQPLRLLWDGAAQSWNLHPELTALDFGKEVVAVLQQAAIFPVISGHYRRAAEVRCLRRPLATFLTPQRLDELVHWPVDTDRARLEQILASLGALRTTLVPLELLRRVAAVRPLGRNADFTAYARLLCLAVDELRSQSLPDAAQWPALFSGPDGAALESSEPVFLPPDQEAARLTVAGLPVVQAELARALRETFQRPTYRALSAALEVLRVRPFEFSELAHYLLQRHGDRLRTLHPALLALYLAERGRGRVRRLVVSPPAPVPLPTRGELKQAPATTLYFGQNLAGGRSLAAELYAHDRNKLVGTTRTMGLEAAAGEDVRDYLTWCGVQELPRWVPAAAVPRAYLDYALRRLNFRRPVEGRSFRNYQEFRQRYSAEYDQGQAVTLDGLTGILKHASPGAILRWIGEQPPAQLAEVLRQDREPLVLLPEQQTSTIRVGRLKSEHLTLPASQLAAYVRWQLATTPWLPGPGEARVAPQQVLLAPRGQRDGEFSPILHSARASLDLLRQRQVGDREARTLLASLGVNQAVSDLPPDLLYQLLLSLPERDQAGERAASLYRELVVGYEVRDELEDDPARLYFLQHGQV